MFFVYDYIVEATSEGGHTYNLIYVDNNWEKFDATPIPWLKNKQQKKK